MAVSKNVTVIPARKHTRKSKDEEKPKLRVAAYCRVSTDSEEQATSYETQIEHYTAYIQGHPDWMLAGIFADAIMPWQILIRGWRNCKQSCLGWQPHMLTTIKWVKRYTGCVTKSKSCNSKTRTERR